MNSARHYLPIIIFFTPVCLRFSLINSKWLKKIICDNNIECYGD